MRITQERRLFAIGFFFSFCIALAAYVNASYLRTFLSTESVGLVYSLTAFMTIVALYFFEYLGGRYGVQKTLVASLMVSGLAAFFFARTTTDLFIIISFVVMQVGLVMTKFSTDILIETHKNKNVGEGTIRGAYLAITNFSWIIAAFLGGYIASVNPQYIYAIGGTIYFVLSIITLYTISQTSKDFFTKSSIWDKIKFTIAEKSTKKIVISEFVLQTFYVIMVVFSPLYLREVSGFSYREIGLVFAIMLIPFALFQYPLGKLADKKYGEKEMMIGAYIILAVSVFAFAMIKNHTFLSAAIILFISRIGACTLEVMNDTYFFSTTKDYSKTIPILKGMAPFALLLFGTIGSTVITFFSYQALFIGLAVFILVVSLANVYKLKDTR